LKSAGFYQRLLSSRRTNPAGPASRERIDGRFSKQWKTSPANRAPGAGSRQPWMLAFVRTVAVA
jgi:hypothetical protein